MSRLHLLNRTLSTTLYFLEFLISILILGIFSYFLAVLARRDNATIPQWQKATEGLSGASALYALFAVILTCFFGGITFFAFLAVLLNILFCGAMVAIAVMTKAATKSCSSTSDDSPIGKGHRTSCNLQKVAFAVSIIAAFLYAISAVSQVALSRSHKREKRYGPSPANNYTSGSGKRKLWERKRKNKNDAEMGAFSTGVVEKNDRTSDYTGTTAPVNEPTYGGPLPNYGQPAVPPKQTYTHSNVGHTTGVAPSSTGVSEMDGSHANTMTSNYGHQDPNPYSELHGSAGYAK